MQKVIDVFDRVIYNEIMRKHREKVLLLLDLFMVVIAFGIAGLLKTNFEFGVSSSELGNVIWLIPVVLLSHLFVLMIFDVHHSLWKYFGLKEVKNITIAISLSTLILVLYGYLMTRSLRIVSYIILSEILTTGLLFSNRFLYRSLRESRVGSPNSVNTIIIGAGDAGYILLKELLRANSNIRIVGFIDDFRSDKRISGYKVLGTVKDLEKIKNKYKISRVYIAMPSVDIKYQKEIFGICQELGLETKVMKKYNHRVTTEGKQMLYPVESVSIDDLLGRGQVDLNDEQISSYISGQNIMVTGAGGSIGSELCRQILKYGPKKLIMVDINENALYMLELELKSKFESTHTQIYANIASVREYDVIDRIIARREVDVVYHAAAHKHVPLMETSPEEAFKNNVMGTKNVIDACIKNKVSRFVLISTDKAVNPTNAMGASKRLCEMIMQSKGNNGVTKLGAVRFGNVLGSAGSVIPIFNEQIKRGGPVEVTHKDITRYFMTIPEASQLVLQAGYYANKGEIYVLDMGEPVKIYDLARKLIQLSGYTPHKDIDIIFSGLRPGEKMYEELSLASEKNEKTENQLIYINQPQCIDSAKLDESLMLISELVDIDEKAGIIKEALLKSIRE